MTDFKLINYYYFKAFFGLGTIPVKRLLVRKSIIEKCK